MLKKNWALLVLIFKGEVSVNTPEIKIIPRANGKGPYGIMTIQADEGKIEIKLDATEGDLGKIYIVIDLCGVEAEELPYHGEIFRYRSEDNVMFSCTNEEKSQKLLDEAVFALEEFLPISELYDFHSYFGLIIKKLERSKK